MKKFYVLLLIAVVLSFIAAPAFAATVEYKSTPATDDEKTVAKAVETFVDAHGGSYAVMAELLTDDVKACCFVPAFGLQSSYEGKMKVAMLYTTTQTINKRASDLAVSVNDGKAEVSGQYDYMVNLGSVSRSRSYSTIWKLRKIGDGWKIYEIELKAR